MDDVSVAHGCMIVYLRVQRAKTRAGWRWAAMPADVRATAIQDEISGVAEAAAVAAAAAENTARLPSPKKARLGQQTVPGLVPGATPSVAEQQMRQMQKQM